jgi:hypothetical protein
MSRAARNSVVRKSIPPPKKALSPGSRAKADGRNARRKAKRAALADASGGAKLAKKRKATTDFAEGGRDARIRRWIKIVSVEHAEHTDPLSSALGST